MNSSPTPTTNTENNEPGKLIKERTKIPSWSQLKSNIPRPVPYVRVVRESRSKSCSSSCFKSQPSEYAVKPLRKRSISQCSPCSEQQQPRCKANPNRHSAQTGSLQSKPLTANSSRSQYCNVKAKIDNSTPACLVQKRPSVCSKDCLMKSDNHIDNRKQEICQVGDKNESNSLINEVSNVDSFVDDISKGSSFNDVRSKDGSFVDYRSKGSTLVYVEDRDNSLVDYCSNDGFLIDNRIKDCSFIDVRSKGWSSVDGKIKDKYSDDGSKYSSFIDDRSKVSSIVDDRLAGRDKDSFFSENIDSESYLFAEKSRGFIEEPPGDQILKINSPRVLRKKIKSLTAYSESDNCQSSLNLQVRERNVSLLEKVFFHQEGAESFLLKKDAREFLSSFGKQMEEILDLWYQLICDLIVTKMTIGKSNSLQLSLCDPKFSWRDVITTFFQNLPTQGELLHRKLCKVEEEQMNVLEVVVQNIAALIKDHEELKRKHSHLVNTYDQTQSRLKEELAILGLENKQLNEKYMLIAENYKLDKLETKELEELQVETFNKIMDLRKVLKHVEGKCKELEKKGEKMDTSRLELENRIQNLETAHEKETKEYDDLLKKYAESKKVISKLIQEIKESENSKTCLDEKVKALHGEVTDLKSKFENSEQKRKELEKEVSDKRKKVKELESEINLLKENKKENLSNNEPSLNENSLQLVKDLVNGVQKRNTQIQELRKKINRLEHMLREKSSREEKLLTNVTKLKKKYSNVCTALNNKIIELQSAEKGLQCQVSELEKVLGQKTLELDQRDRMIKELQELVRLKNECDSAVCQSKKNNRNEKLTRTESDESLSGKKKMIELFSLLEQKQMEIMKLECRIWGLQSSKIIEEDQEEKKETKDISGGVN